MAILARGHPQCVGRHSERLFVCSLVPAGQAMLDEVLARTQNVAD